MSVEVEEGDREALHAIEAIALLERMGRSVEGFGVKYADDFYGFCDLLEIKPKEAGGGGLIPFRLTRIQRAYCGARTARDVILKARQVKITSIELARDVWYFLTKRGVNVRVVCQSSTDNSMANELSERIGIIFAAVRKNAGLALEFASESRTSWVLPSGSTLKIVAAGASEKAAQKKVRGETVHRLHTTELAFWEYAGLTLNAMLEAIAAPEFGTEVVHESTPNGAAGGERGNTKDAPGGAYFYWLCQDAKAGVGEHKFHFFSWLECEEYQADLDTDEVVEPETDRERVIAQRGATAEQLKWYRAKVLSKGQDDTDQEYASDPDTCFLVSGRQFFEKAVTDRMLVACTDPIATREVRRPGALGTVRVWAAPEYGASYVLALDPSEGSGGDASAGTLRERATARHMLTIHGQFQPHELAAEAAKIGLEYNGATIAVERNNHGHACLRALDAEQSYPDIFCDRDRKLGWLNVEASRTAALDALEQQHRAGTWTTLDATVVAELRTFVVNKHGRAEGARGANDDLVLAEAICLDVIGRTTSSDEVPDMDYTNRETRSLGFG